MKLRKPCQHNLYDGHNFFDVASGGYEFCPGGVFLPDDTLIIEKVDGEWPQWVEDIVADHDEPVVRSFLSRLTEQTELDRNQLGMW